MSGILIRSSVVICLQIWQRLLLQRVLPLEMLSEVSNLEEVRSLLRLGGWRNARRGGSEKIPERDGCP